MKCITGKTVRDRQYQTKRNWNLILQICWSVNLHLRSFSRTEEWKWVILVIRSTKKFSVIFSSIFTDSEHICIYKYYVLLKFLPHRSPIIEDQSLTSDQECEKLIQVLLMEFVWYANFQTEVSVELQHSTFYNDNMIIFSDGSFFAHCCTFNMHGFFHVSRLLVFFPWKLCSVLRTISVFRKQKLNKFLVEPKAAVCIFHHYSIIPHGLPETFRLNYINFLTFDT